MALRLQAAHLAAISRHGEETYPHECCGILLGYLHGDLRIVTEAARMRNANTVSPRNRFDFDPQEHLALQRTARERGVDVVGFYHSHPDHPARPSQYDLDHAAWPGYSYLIVSVAQGRAGEMNSYELAADRSHFIQEAIETEPGDAAASPAGTPAAATLEKR